MKDWIKDLMTSILANILTPVVIVLLAMIAALLVAGYVMFRDNLQAVLLLLLIVLSVLNTSAILYVIRQQRHVLGMLNGLREKQTSILIMLNASDSGAGRPIPKLSPADMHRFEVKDRLPVTNKVFDDTTDPQRIHLEFTNADAGENVFHIRTIKYRGTGGEFGIQNLSARYRREGAYLIIPCDQKEVTPGQILAINLELRNKWATADMNRMAGSWGWLTFEVTFKGEPLELPPYAL